MVPRHYGSSTYRRDELAERILTTRCGVYRHGLGLHRPISCGVPAGSVVPTAESFGAAAWRRSALYGLVPAILGVHLAVSLLIADERRRAEEAQGPDRRSGFKMEDAL